MGSFSTFLSFSQSWQFCFSKVSMIKTYFSPKARISQTLMPCCVFPAYFLIRAFHQIWQILCNALRHVTASSELVSFQRGASWWKSLLHGATHTICYFLDFSYKHAATCSLPFLPPSPLLSANLQRQSCVRTGDRKGPSSSFDARRWRRLGSRRRRG